MEQDQSASHMFQNAARIGIEGSQFTNVQGNMNVHSTVSPTIPRDSDPHSTGNTGAMTTGMEYIPSPARDAPGVRTYSASYCSQLLRQGRGFPLYVPTPQINLPPEYRRTGVSIGDVGRMTAEGVFDFFFNIYRASDDPINAKTPEDFVPLSPYDPIDIVHLEFDAGDYVSTPSVQELDRGSEPFPGGEFGFNCFVPNGAVLTLPHGAQLEKLENLDCVRRYAAKHAERWYNYVNGTRGRGLANGSLYLVTGCEKTNSWGMASFHDVASQNEFELTFKPSADADSGYKYRWQRGTPARQKHADPPLVDEAPLNQTTFIHAFTISLAESLWGKLFGDVEIGQLVDSQLAGSGPGSVPYGSQKSSFTWSLNPFGGNAASGGNQCTVQNTARGDVVMSDAALVPKLFHPSQMLNEHILRECPEATVAITHDDDWSDIFYDDGTDAVVKDPGEFLERVFEHFVATTENGAVFLSEAPLASPDVPVASSKRAREEPPGTSDTSGQHPKRRKTRKDAWMPGQLWKHSVDQRNSTGVARPNSSELSDLLIGGNGSSFQLNLTGLAVLGRPHGSDFGSSG